MKWLDVYAPQGRGAFLCLQELLDTSPKRMHTSFWRVGEYVEEDHKSEFDCTGDRLVERLEALKLSGNRICFEELLSLANEEGQIIWASFFGYDDRSNDKPWIVLSAVDSSFWRFDTDDMSVRKWVRSSFDQVRIGQL